jgi:DNA-binding Lrp family transcriptional regulator
MLSAEKIDEIDVKILKDLLIDGRKEFTEIAREAQVSKDVVWQHYTRMKKEGIIVGATIQLNYAALGYDVSASFIVDVQVGQQEQVMGQLRKIPGIYDAYRWGSHSRVWAVSGLMKAEQIERVKQLIKKLPSILRLEVEIWTGAKRAPENLSVLTNDKIPSDTEKAEIRTENRIEKNVRKIDAIDRQLIEKLVVNSRASFSGIGKELGISTSTAIRRYNKLKRNGIIRAMIQINPTRIGYPIEACFKLTINFQRDLNDIAEKIAGVPDVVGVLKIIGAHDLAVFTGIRNLEHLVALETEIANIQGVREMEAPVLNQFPVLPYPREHISTF